MEKNYNFGGLRKIEGKGITVGYLTGLTILGKNKTELVSERTVTIKGEEKKIVSFLLSTKQGKGKMKYNFGEEFHKEDHIIRVSIWGDTAERYLKATKSAKCILGLFGALKVVETEYNGKKYKNIEMSVDDFQIIKKLEEKTAENSLETVEPVEAGDMPF